MTGPFAQAARQAGALDESGHRPWPAPQRHWLLAQTWEDVLFAHWPIARERLQDLVPGLSVDTFDGHAWLGVTPLVLSGVRIAGAPPVPWISRFPETNVRTYVTVDGKPGIYFFSLDAASRAAVRVARRLYRLPYFDARMAAHRRHGWVEYASRRTDRRGQSATLRARYRGRGRGRAAAPGTIEHFLAERYCLYTVAESGAVYRAEIHHAPWPLQDAEAELEENTMPPGELRPLTSNPMFHYSDRQDALIWSLERA